MPLKPIIEVEAYIAFEPIDDITRTLAYNYLQQHYPEVEWNATVINGNLKINPIFKSNEEETFYTLKWLI